MFLMSKSTAAKLTDVQMNIIKEAAKNATKYERQLMADQDAAYLKTLRDNGMDVYDVDRAKFKEASASVYVKYGPVFGQDLIDQIIELGK